VSSAKRAKPSAFRSCLLPRAAAAAAVETFNEADHFLFSIRPPIGDRGLNPQRRYTPY